MHGSKKWIRDRHGRLKKSSDRTYKDWLGDLNNSHRRNWKYWYDCEDCQCNAEYNNVQRWYRRAFECESCRKAHTDLYGRDRKKWYKTGVPKWFRQAKNREYRNTVKQIIRNAKYVEELYDMIPPDKKDAAYDYW
jgi:hypothetical protein